MKVSLLSALRWRFDAGRTIELSFERGRCLRLLLLTEAEGVWLTEGENMVDCMPRQGGSYRELLINNRKAFVICRDCTGQKASVDC